MTAMSDASKRRMDSDDASQASSPSSQTSAEHESINFGKNRKGYSKASDDLFPVATTTDPKIPLREGIDSVGKWGKTICRMDKFKSESLTYDHMIFQARSNSKAGEDMRQYL